MRRISIVALSISSLMFLSGCLTAPDDNNDPTNTSTSDAGMDTGGDTSTLDTSEPDLAPDVPCGGCAITEVCDVDSGRCVDCLGDDDCTASVCDPNTNSCVECVTTADCPTGVCDSDNTNTCGECVGNSDCSSANASVCDTATLSCTQCAESTDCEHLSDTTVCDGGECVECTGTEYMSCGGVCDSQLKTCTNTAAGLSGLCEDCVSDAQCREGMLCVPLMFEDDVSGPTNVGTYCLWRQDATVANAPAGVCSSVLPYADIVTDAVSIDQVTANVCGLKRTTCPGLNAYQDSCPTAGMHDDCGASGLKDGLCIAVDPQTNKCTVPCNGDDDCPGMCDTATTPFFCEL